MESTNIEKMSEDDLSKINKKERSSNFELLRIVCTILIVFHHLCAHSVVPEGVTPFNLFIIKVGVTLGKLAVNVYVLISGYFLVKSKFKVSKLIKNIFQIMFFELLLYSISCWLDVEPFNWKNFMYCFFPVSTRRYWFMQNYVVLYMLSPFINKALNHCNKKEHLLLILALLFLQIEIPYVRSFFTINELLWFITLYVISAYIRLYEDMLTSKKRIALPAFILTFSLIVYLYVKDGTVYFTMTHCVLLVCSISLFCVFKNIKMRSYRAINLISVTTLGVYLIHDGYHISGYLWNVFFNVPFHSTANIFPLYVIVAIITVFSAGFVVDTVRRIVFDKIEVLIKKKLIHKEKQKNNSQESN